ncbi:MAG: crotonase/enoyl-CoA hydratase family protein [Pyrinomonadaceae bacterium]|nr:crotonase/enoyl-CoA hydratase family protein [Pyrinomonadaceae bacterium]
MPDAVTQETRIAVEERGHVLLIGINRPNKLNAFDKQMFDEISLAFAKLEDDDNLRCAVVYANGRAFTAGLDLANVAPLDINGELDMPVDGVDPWAIFASGRTRTKPAVVATHGKCFTIGIELILALDVCVASEDATFAQIEVQRGIFPFCGATIRFPQIAGWGNAMRWILTGDEFDAKEALRIGLVQEIVEAGKQLERAIEIAERIAAQAPFGVRATIASARTAQNEGSRAAAEKLLPEVVKIFATEDANEGTQSFIERRKAVFKGR